MNRIVWHYAVWKGRYPFMWPACTTLNGGLSTNEKHGITINRGDVDCSECLRMMGDFNGRTDLVVGS